MQRVKTIYLDQTDSTQTYAKKNAEQFDPKGITCIVAESQTAGRGRLQRNWHSPAGVNLYLTLYFTLPLQTPHLGCLAQILGYTLITLIQDLHPKVKWPNDVQINGKKLAGILCETSFRKDRIDCFLGIGINVNMDKSDLAQIDQPATSLKEETGKNWDRNALLEQLLEKWSHDLILFRAKGFHPFHAPLEELLAYKNQEISVNGHKGICYGLAEDGRLKLYHPETKNFTLISSGDLLPPDFERPLQ